MIEYIRFPLLAAYIRHPNQPYGVNPIRGPRGIDVHRLKGNHNREIHDVVKETLHPTLVAWMDEHTPGVQISWIELIFRNSREAFAFKMRWGGVTVIEDVVDEHA